jgi:hypothetical protein
MFDKDYISYLKEDGKNQEAIWLYLDYITEMLENICKRLPIEKDEEQKLMGQFKIQPQSGGGARKGPPPVIV